MISVPIPLLPKLIGGPLILLGAATGAGGVWLASLGGSPFYAASGAAMLVTGWLLARGRPAALWAGALLVGGTLLWALWEVGLDWWPLAARGDVVFVIGLVLLTPWLRRALGRAEDVPVPLLRGGGLALCAVLAAALAVAAVSWTRDPHRIAGAWPERAADGTSDAGGVPPGEWHAYGRSAAGQRWSPLAQITPGNVARLDVAWHYHTGDLRGREGDPKETTFEVTPLKIGNRLFFCTPHQDVVALDATTGREVWRHETRIRGELALQHLTCRGLAYFAGGETRPNVAAPGTPRQVAAAPSPVSDLPVAAEDAPTAECDARLLMPTADGRLIALSPETGAICSDFGGGTGQVDLWANMPNVRPGAYYSTSPPVVAGGLVVVGGTVLDNVSTREQSGVIRAYDVRTGALVWNWDSGKPDETAPLAPGESYSVNSPNSWSIMSADEELGLVYVPLGNQPPDQWGANRSPAVERFSSAVVALELATGRMRWVFQAVHHDVWDYDVPSQPTLVDLTIGGQRVPALVQPTKQGELFVLDRRSGEPVLPVREVPAPGGALAPDRAATTQPVSALSFDPPPLRERDMWGATLFDQLACRIQFRRLRYEGRFTPPSLQGSIVYPGNFGVFNWGGIAVDPRRGIAFTTPAYLAFVSRLVPRPDATALVVNDAPPKGSLPALNENFGAPYAAELKPFLSAIGLPCQAPPWGYVAGADLTTGQIAWMHRNGTVRDLSPVPLPFRMGVPDLGGPVATAGGVAFLSGTLDYYVRAYDLTTGREIWKDRLPAGGQATPMTYEGEDGRQYVLVVAGGHGSLGTKAGDSVIAYALPR
jgi:quinoprotein glucose dehydrogenase